MMKSGLFSIRNILVFIIFFLGLIGIISFAILGLSLNSGTSSTEVSDRNNILSQKIALYANLYVNGSSEARDICAESVDEFQKNLNALNEGGEIDIAGKSLLIDKPDKLTIDKIAAVEKVWNNFNLSINVILTEALYDDSYQINQNIKSSLKYINAHAPSLLKEGQRLSEAYVLKSQIHEQNTWRTLIMLVVIWIVVVMAAISYASISFTKPLTYLIKKLEELTKGGYEGHVELKRKNEFSVIAKYINEVFGKFRLAATYVEELGKGNLKYEIDSEQKELVEEDRIFTALKKTQEELIRVDTANETRQWSNEGIRIISELLQKRYDEVQDLYDELVSTIVQYVGANQGGIFLDSEIDGKDCLELMGCYAYERKKFLHQAYDKDEGLLGQTFREGNLMLLTEVPENYIRITSGLGKSTL